MTTWSHEHRIAQARTLLESEGLVASEYVNDQIRDSWQRCIDAGLHPSQEPAKKIVEQRELDDLLEQNNDLISLATVEMKNLHRQIAGTNFFILMASKESVILKSMLDASLGASEMSDILPGNIWEEHLRGTNAIGTAATTDSFSTVHAGEHFFEKYTNLTCAAVPINAPDGELLGVLDASSDCRHRQHHTLALVKMSGLILGRLSKPY